MLSKSISGDGVPERLRPEMADSRDSPSGIWRARSWGVRIAAASETGGSARPVFSEVLELDDLFGGGTIL